MDTATTTHRPTTQRPTTSWGWIAVAVGTVVLSVPALGFVIHSYAAGAWTTSLCLGG